MNPLRTGSVLDLCICTSPSPAPLEESRKAGTPGQLGGTEGGKGAWCAAGGWAARGLLPGTREPATEGGGQRRPGSEMCSRMMMVLVLQGGWQTADGSP